MIEWLVQHADPLLQPHKGSSETTQNGTICRQNGSFNPTRVRLKRSNVDQAAPQEFGFNPTRVRLKRRAPIGTSSCVAGFNPTRVRLKPSQQEFRRRDHRMLQPHKGSSETRRCSFWLSVPERALQPHKGSSETFRPYFQKRRSQSFNPTRVRLKLTWIQGPVLMIIGFNPTRVRLKPAQAGY